MLQGCSARGVRDLPRQIEGDQVVTSHGKGEYVDPLVGRTSPHDLRGHVQRCPGAIPRRHERLGRRKSKPKIDQLDLLHVLEHDVIPRANIPVDEFLAMKVR